jgi:AcrR family transcriptional regulator
MLLNNCPEYRRIPVANRLLENDCEQKSGTFGVRVMERKADRRTARTQRALRSALIGLLRRKDYDAITVQEIIDEADVGRSTFYAHCSGKDQLLRLSLQMLRTELTATQHIERARRGEPGLAFSLPVLEHVREHRDLYPSLAHGRGRELFMSELRFVVSELVRSDIAELPAVTGVPLEIRIQYVVGAFMAVLTWWIEHKLRSAPVEVDGMFQRLSRGTVATA